MIITRQNIKTYFLYILYRIILDFLYVNWIHPLYINSGFVYDPNIYKLIVSYLIIIILLIIMPKSNLRVSYRILQLHLIIMIIPLSTLYALANLSTKFIFMVFICFSIQLMLIRVHYKLKVNEVKNANVIIAVIIICISIATYLYLFITQGIYFNAFNFNEIYEIRANTDVSSTIMNYLISWQYRIINPFIIVLSYFKKNYKIFFAGMFLQTFLYFMYPHKEVFMSIGLILLVLFTERNRIKFDEFIIKFLVIAAGISVIIYEGFKNMWPLAIVTVRLIYIPAILKFMHYNFFLINEKLFYSEGLIGKLFGIKYPYSVPSGFLVDNPNSNNNAGYLAYAYDNAGLLGMIIMSVVFILFLLLIDSFSNENNVGIYFSLLVYPMIVLNDGDLLTSFLTGGLFLLIILMYLIKDTFNKTDNKTEIVGRNL